MAIEEELLNQLTQQTAILQSMAGTRGSGSTNRGGINFDDVENASSDLAKSLNIGAKAVSSGINTFTGALKGAGSSLVWFIGLFGANA